MAYLNYKQSKVNNQMNILIEEVQTLRKIVEKNSKEKTKQQSKKQTKKEKKKKTSTSR